LRPSKIEYTLPPGRPACVAVAQWVKNRNNASVSTEDTSIASLSSQRQNARRSKAQARTVRGE
jgi:hypothetical protein